MKTASSLTSFEPYERRCHVPYRAGSLPANAANGIPPTPPERRKSKASTDVLTTARS